MARSATPPSKEALRQKIRRILGTETRDQLKDLIL